MFVPHAFFKLNSTNSNMKVFIFLFIFLFAVDFTLISCQKESSDNDSTADTHKERKTATKSKTAQETESSGKTSEEPEPEHPNPEFLITPDDRLIINPSIQKTLFPQSDPDPNVGPRGPPFQSRQDLYLTDNRGKYNVHVENFQQQKPTPFTTAVGAISAHILNQRTNEEYIPYPPNGDPYNYPAYRGYPHATEPPVVRAYETANNANYNPQPSANFEQENPRRAFSGNDYHQEFPNQFESFGLGFYSNPYIFNEGGFYPGLRRSDGPIHNERYRPDRRQDFSRVIKRLI